MFTFSCLARNSFRQRLHSMMRSSKGFLCSLCSKKFLQRDIITIIIIIIIIIIITWNSLCVYLVFYFSVFVTGRIAISLTGSIKYLLILIIIIIIIIITWNSLCVYLVFYFSVFVTGRIAISLTGSIKYLLILIIVVVVISHYCTAHCFCKRHNYYLSFADKDTICASSSYSNYTQNITHV